MQQMWGFLAEVVLFAAFVMSFLILATLRTPASNWAMIPHLLCNLGLVILLAKHLLERKPPLYWSGFDTIVVLLFFYFLANVCYSEIRAVSWREAALYFDSFAAYLFGRMLF